MGLRFRKSISIIPGVKLNFGKTGMSVSTGVPGFRKTFHTSGRVTTSVGIPGTGLYYVDTKNSKTQKSQTFAQPRRETSTYYPDSTFEGEYQNTNHTTVHNNNSLSSVPKSNLTKQIDSNSLKSIHKSSDDSIDWTEVLVSPTPPDGSYNQQMWTYYHSVASKILAGDIDTYLQIIYEVNPLDDLLTYGSNYEFGTDNPKKIEVEFNVNVDALSEARLSMSNAEYNLLLQDYVCSISIRIARDMFALLPIRNTIVHTVLNEKTILSVDFDRESLSKVKFGYIDPSETLRQFMHKMDFDELVGFSPVSQLE